MKNWKDWIKIRESFDELGGAIHNDEASDYEHTGNELFKILMDKYHGETMDFLSVISQRDNEVANLLNKINRKNPPPMQDPNHPSEKDEVVPPESDFGYNDEGEENQ